MYMGDVQICNVCPVWGNLNCCFVTYSTVSTYIGTLTLYRTTLRLSVYLKSEVVLKHPFCRVCFCVMYH